MATMDDFDSQSWLKDPSPEESSHKGMWLENEQNQPRFPVDVLYQ